MLEERLTGNLCSSSQVVKPFPLCWFLCCIYPRPKPISVQYLQPHQKRRAFTAPRQNRRKLTFPLRKCLANPFSSPEASRPVGCNVKPKGITLFQAQLIGFHPRAVCLHFPYHWQYKTEEVASASYIMHYCVLPSTSV